MKKKSYEAPSAGIFYLVPNKKTKKYEIYTQLEEGGEDVVHLFLWDSVIRKLQMMKANTSTIEDSYRGLPRGRIIAPVTRGGDWIVGWGDDFPLAQYEHDILSEFNLGGAKDLGHVKFEVQSHEKMIPKDKKEVENALGIEMTPTGFIARK